MTSPETARVSAQSGSPAFRDVLATSQGAGEARPATGSEAVRQMLAHLDPSALSSVVDRLKEAGIAPDRWVSPNLHAQLRQAMQRPPKFVLCGAIDLDPALPLQRTLAAEHAMDIAAGAAALGKLLGARRVVLVVPEDMAATGIAGLREAAQAAMVRLFPVMERYPLAQASLLIQRTTGLRLPPSKLPTDVGVVLLDAPAALAIGRLFIHAEPMRRVPMGIYDEPHSRGHLLRVPVGSKLSEVLTAAEIHGDATELWSGHVLRQLPIDRNTALGDGELTIFASSPRRGELASACLRCGWCVEACPVRIQPAGLLDAAQQNDPQLAEQYGLRSCIDCGICSNVCPSRLPLLASIRQMRNS